MATIEPHSLERTLADILDQLDEVYCDNPESEETLYKCCERLWRVLQDIKLAEPVPARDMVTDGRRALGDRLERCLLIENPDLDSVFD